MKRVTKNAANHNGEWLEVAVASMREVLRNDGATLDFAGREEMALGLGNEIVRRALERELQEQADAEPRDVRVGGDTYRKHQRGTVRYHSLVGALRVTRWSYRARGRRNGPTVVPLELTAMMVSRATPTMSRVVAHGYANVSSRQLVRDLALVARSSPSRATLERMGRALGARAYEELPVSEPRVRAAERVPSHTAAMHVGLDRTSAPMREPGVKGTQYRMAWVGTVALTAQDGALLASWRYAAPASDGPAKVFARMMADVRKVESARGPIFLWPSCRTVPLNSGA